MVKFLSVKCSRCNQEKIVNPDAYQKRLDKYGSLQEMESKWECRTCSKIEKKEDLAFKTIKDCFELVKKTENVEIANNALRTMMDSFNVIQSILKVSIEEQNEDLEYLSDLEAKSITIINTVIELFKKLEEKENIKINQI